MIVSTVLHHGNLNRQILQTVRLKAMPHTSDLAITCTQESCRALRVSQFLLMKRVIHRSGKPKKLKPLAISHGPERILTLIWDQKNKKTARPTVRWVFMIFEDVLLLYKRTSQSIEKQAMNLREEHRIVLECLGLPFEKMYFCESSS